MPLKSDEFGLVQTSSYPKIDRIIQSKETNLINELHLLMIQFSISHISWYDPIFITMLETLPKYVAIIW